MLWSLLVPALLLAVATEQSAVPLPQLVTTDVDRFYALYTAAHGLPRGEDLQRDYIDGGSPGVRQFVENRILSGEALAKEIAKEPAIYANARKCTSALPAVRERLKEVFRKMAALEPQAHFAPVTILVGRDNSGGTTGKSGVLIGLEVVCRSDWLQPDIADRFVHLIAHEYGHLLQFPDGGEDKAPTTVLSQSLVEGGAEFIAEMTSGEVSNVQLQRWTRGHEMEIAKAFLAEADSKDLSHWLYNGVGTPDRPGDLGYWVGYQIVKGYYEQAPDKRAAWRQILSMDHPREILAQSGWPAVR
jgi:hypothetical protein